MGSRAYAERYVFHLWSLTPSGKSLAILSPVEVAAHVPVENGQGRWETLAIPFTVFRDSFKAAGRPDRSAQGLSLDEFQCNSAKNSKGARIIIDVASKIPRSLAFRRHHLARAISFSTFATSASGTGIIVLVVERSAAWWSVTRQSAIPPHPDTDSSIARDVRRCRVGPLRRREIEVTAAP